MEIFSEIYFWTKCQETLRIKDIQYALVWYEKPLFHLVHISDIPSILSYFQICTNKPDFRHNNSVVRRKTLKLVNWGIINCAGLSQGGRICLAVPRQREF